MIQNELYHQTLTSIAFTEPLWEDSESSHTYIDFISSHVPLSNKTTLMDQFNITSQELPSDDSSNSFHINMANMGNHHNPKLDDFLIYRALEIYLYWNSYINYLRVPIFRVEDLSLDHNVTVLDEIFRSIGRNPPSHEKVLDILKAQRQQHRHHRRALRRLQQQQQQQQEEEEMQLKQPQLTEQLPSASKDRRQLVKQQLPRKRIRKGSRIHRPSLSWEEICRAGKNTDMAQSFLIMSQSFGYYQDMDVTTLCD